jgi:hypothetical protein
VSFFNRFPFSEFTPEPGSNHSGYCLTNKKGRYLLYIPKENHKLSMNWKNPIAQEGGTIQWFNTLTGEYTAIEAQTESKFTSPWRGTADAILIRTLAK